MRRTSLKRPEERIVGVPQHSYWKFMRFSREMTWRKSFPGTLREALLLLKIRPNFQKRCCQITLSTITFPRLCANWTCTTSTSQNEKMTSTKYSSTNSSIATSKASFRISNVNPTRLILWESSNHLSSQTCLKLIMALYRTIRTFLIKTMMSLKWTHIMHLSKRNINQHLFSGKINPFSS